MAARGRFALWRVLGVDDGLGLVSGIIAAAIAVLGTLLGVVVTHLYQERTAARSAARADRERKAQRLLDACADFIALAEDYRRAQYDRWTSAQATSGSGAETEAGLAARAESFRLYVEVRGSVFRLRLVALDSPGQRLAELAAEIQVMTREIFFARDKPDMLARGARAEHACEAFVVRAREVLAAGDDTS
ncbi:hypothetical protein ACGFMM_24225 [Streptomyces sp. NPDC048604]|uniref:hypothetical protein n=1 Tax=Streptomyces sp. NPDC048604 TaxID=3365578 RepID=UPI0037113B99